MDTVTEATWRSPWRSWAGIGVLHRNLSSRAGRRRRQVKRFESGMVVNPITIAP
jgi:IMP dehydrogenase